MRLSGHEAPKDNDILDTIERMGEPARAQVSQAKQAFATRNVAVAQQLVGPDGEIDRLNRDIIARAVDIGDHVEVREWAMCSPRGTVFLRQQRNDQPEPKRKRCGCRC